MKQCFFFVLFCFFPQFQGCECILENSTGYSGREKTETFSVTYSEMENLYFSRLNGNQGRKCDPRVNENWGQNKNNNFGQWHRKFLGFFHVLPNLRATTQGQCGRRGTSGRDVVSCSDLLSVWCSGVHEESDDKTWKRKTNLTAFTVIGIVVGCACPNTMQYDLREPR